MTCFRYPGCKPSRFTWRLFHNQEDAIECLEDQWDGLRSLAQELGKSWENGKAELVLARFPDEATCAEEWRAETHVYGKAPPDNGADEERNAPAAGTCAGGSSGEGGDAITEGADAMSIS